MIFSHEKYHHDVNVQHFFIYVLFDFFDFSCFSMIFHVFFYKKINRQVQVWCKFAANLHQTCTASFIYFVFFVLFFVFFVFLTCFFHVVYCFVCENHLVLVGNKWITTVCVQVF